MKLLRAAGSCSWLGLWLAVGLSAGRAVASPTYNSGPLMTGTSHVYFIWYGDWSSNTATSVLPSFISNLSGSSYMNIVTSYSTGPYTIGNQVQYMGGAFVNSTSNSSIYTAYGTNLDGTAGDTTPASGYSGTISQIVAGVLAANSSWATDTNGIFDVLTAQSISVSSFNSGGTTFCGWHYSTNWGKSSLGNQYGFIGDPTGTSCTNYAPSHNSPDATNIGADVMTGTIAHELFETVTDPTGRGWFDSNGKEIADVCEPIFGTLSTSNGQNYNTTLNGTNYDVPEIWLNQGSGACSLSLALSSSSTPEPASFALLLPGLIGLAAVRWRFLH